MPQQPDPQPTPQVLEPGPQQASPQAAAPHDTSPHDTAPHDAARRETIQSLDDIPDRSAGCFHLRQEGDLLAAEFDTDSAHLHDVRVAVESFCREGGFDERSCCDVGLAVNEAIANIIRHAYRSSGRMPIDLTARRSPDEMTIELRDWGVGEMPPEQSRQWQAQQRAACTRVESDLAVQPGGLGLVCIKTLMDSVKFLPQPRGMLLQMTRSRQRAAPNV